MSKFLEETELWMSSGGTSSLLHSHADHNMHCVLAGRKDFILIHPKYKDKLAFHSNVSESGVRSFAKFKRSKKRNEINMEVGG